MNNLKIPIAYESDANNVNGIGARLKQRRLSKPLHVETARERRVSHAQIHVPIVVSENGDNNDFLKALQQLSK